MTEDNMSLHEKDGRRWTYMPNREPRENSGKRYEPIIAFAEDAGRRFNERMLKAIEEQCGDLLKLAGTAI